jgi:hypothetical protein
VLQNPEDSWNSPKMLLSALMSRKMVYFHVKSLKMELRLYTQHTLPPSTPHFSSEKALITSSDEFS